MATKRCPKCQLVNRAAAQRCDCGWQFDTQTMGPALERVVSTEEQLETARLRSAAPFLLVTGIAALGRLVYVEVRDGHYASDLPATIAIAGFGLALVIVGVVLFKKKRRR